MRPRTQEELQSPERLARLAASGQTTPRVVREWVRKHHVAQAVERLYEIGMGSVKFEVASVEKDGKVEVISVEATPAVQRAALADIIRIGVPQQVGISDDDGNTVPGVIALPLLEMSAVQAAAHRQRQLGPGEPGEEREGVEPGEADLGGEEYIELRDVVAEEPAPARKSATKKKAASKRGRK